MALLQSDRYQSGYFHKRWVKYYSLGEISVIFCSKFVRCQSPYQLQNLKILLPQNPTQTKFLEFEFFYLKRRGHILIKTKRILNQCLTDTLNQCLTNV